MYMYLYFAMFDRGEKWEKKRKECRYSWQENIIVNCYQRITVKKQTMISSREKKKDELKKTGGN